MIPANQRLGTEQAAAGNLDLRLIMQHELAGIQRPTQSREQRHLCHRLVVHLIVEETIGVTPRFLGAVHRHVGFLEQRAIVSTVLRIDRHANRHRRVQFLLGNLERLIQPHHQFACKGRDGIGFGDIRQQQQKLIPALAAHRIGGAHALFKPLRHLDQQLIADVMPQHIVDRLETVEIDQQQCHLGAGTRRKGNRLLQAVLEQLLIRQLRQHIVVEQEFGALFRPTTLGNIGKHPNAIVDPAIAAQRPPGQFAPEGVAVPAPHHQGRRKLLPRTAQRSIGFFAHGHEGRVGLIENTRRLTNQLARPVIKNFLEAMVAGNDLAPTGMDDANQSVLQQRFFLGQQGGNHLMRFFSFRDIASDQHTITIALQQGRAQGQIQPDATAFTAILRQHRMAFDRAVPRGRTGVLAQNRHDFVRIAQTQRGKGTTDQGLCPATQQKPQRFIGINDHTLRDRQHDDDIAGTVKQQSKTLEAIQIFAQLGIITLAERAFAEADNLALALFPIVRIRGLRHRSPVHRMY